MPAAKATGRDKPVPYDRCSPHVGAPAPAWKFRIAFRPVSRNRRPTASQAASYAVPTDAIGQLARRMVDRRNSTDVLGRFHRGLGCPETGSSLLWVVAVSRLEREYLLARRLASITVFFG